MKLLEIKQNELGLDADRNDLLSEDNAKNCFITPHISRIAVESSSILQPLQ